MIDLHAHILPGIDDGPGDMDKAVAMCRAAAADGITKIVASPHMLDDLYDATCDEILAGVSALQECLDKEGVELALEPGADVHITTDLCGLLSEGRVMTVGNRGKYVMIELSQDVLPHGLVEFLFSIHLAGFIPIISHPERNLEIQDTPEILADIVKAGTLTQLTATCVTGQFGVRAEKCAHELLVKRLAHVVASDAHSLRRRPPGLSQARAVVAELLSPQEAEEMFVHRPAKILAGDELVLPEPAQDSSFKKRRWFSWIK